MQPVSLEDDISGGDGARVVERVKVFIPEPDALRAAFETGKADRVRWFNREYKVERSEAWGKYSQAVLFRET